MPTINLLAERVAPVSPKASVAEVFNWFAANPDALALPVVEDGRPLGLIDRQDFLHKLAEPLGHSRYGSRPVSHIMDSEPAVVEGSTKIEAFTNIVLKSSAGTVMRGFIITRDGQYLGVGTVISLLHLANRSQKEIIQQQQAEIELLKAAPTEGSAVAKTKRDFFELLYRELSPSLNAIRTFSELLAQTDLAPNAVKHNSAIKEAINDSLIYLDDIRELECLQNKVLDLNLQPTLIRSFVSEISGRWIKQTKQTGVSILVSYEGDSELVAMIDPARFGKTVDSLIHNALNFVRNGIIEAGIKAEMVNDQIEISVRVRDDGPGLEEEQLCDLFSTSGAYSTHHTASAGLLLQALGGSIWAKNNQGNGTTYGFEVMVPVAHIEEPEAENLAHLNQLDLSNTPHVLIADDNTTNRVVAQALCEMFGCSCESVEDGVQALEAARNGHFDLILMDIKMPRMDGLQATKAIHELGADFHSLPIIALTANADPDDAASYIAAGMHSVVEKPIKPERLRAAMVRALSPKQASPVSFNLRQAG